MAVSAKFLQLDGDAVEVAQVLAVMARAGAPLPIDTPAAPADAIVEAPAEPEQLIEERRAPVVELVEDDEPDVYGGEPLEGGPFESAEDVPPAWRWVSANGFTCHIRTQPGVALPLCKTPPKKIGARRLHDSEIPFRNTEVCEGCNAELVRSRRTA